MSLPSQLLLKPFYFIRHGQTDWNAEGRIMGSKDIPLNIVGRQQAHEASKLLEGLAITTICHSPLKRAQETAEIIAKIIKCPLLEIDDLKECFHGSWEGLLKKDIKDFDPWRKRPIDGETMEYFFSRVHKALHQALTYPESVLIVAHGGVYWMLCHYLKTQLGTINLETCDNCVPLIFSPPQKANETWNVACL